MDSRIKVFMLLSKIELSKSKTLVHFESHCSKIDMQSFHCVQKGQSFRFSDKIAKTSSNFTFSTIAEGIEGIFKTAFDITFSKMT